MKTNFTFTLALLLICTVNFAQTSSCPSSFRRNNGNGSCPDGQLKLYFTSCPTILPIIDSVYTNGVKQTITFGLPDASKCNQLNYIGYCVAGGNMPPSATWVIFFHNTGSLDAFGCTVTEGNTLPVVYQSFDAVVIDKTVLLKWVTDQEINNDHFEVMRSFDGTNFTTIGLVLDGFANGSKKSYQFKDNATELQSKSGVYYRLKQIDNDGKSTYTNTLVVKLQSKSGVIMQTSPNPFTENLNLSFSATTNGNAEISITSITGQKIVTKQSTISKGYNNLQVNGLANLAPGMYTVQLIMNGTVISNQKIIKN